MRGADLVAKKLEELGVTKIFTLSGNHIMPLFDALISTRIVNRGHVAREAAYDAPSIQMTRHDWARSGQ